MPDSTPNKLISEEHTEHLRHKELRRLRGYSVIFWSLAITAVTIYFYKEDTWTSWMVQWSVYLKGFFAVALVPDFIVGHRAGKLSRLDYWYIPFTLVAVLTLGWFVREHDNHRHALIVTVIVRKESYFCTGNCGYYNVKPNTPVWQYDFTTTVDGVPCYNGVKVNYKTYNCAYGSKTVTEAQWQKLNIGDVLKVIELK